uniref:Putative secreted protein n=1 Tax=Rhipicephalus microplus TaxID=6941 RepID=A0A6G5A1I4_RHIMP
MPLSIFSGYFYIVRTVLPVRWEALVQPWAQCNYVVYIKKSVCEVSSCTQPSVKNSCLILRRYFVCTDMLQPDILTLFCSPHIGSNT